MAEQTKPEMGHPVSAVPMPGLSVKALWRDEAVRFSLIIFLILRIATALAGAVMQSRDPLGTPELLFYDPVTGEGNPSAITFDKSIPADAPLAFLSKPWNRYDTAWYVLIAMEGYARDLRIVFPPLLPTLTRVVGPLLGGNYVLASVLVGNIACLIAFILLYKIAQREAQAMGEQDGHIAARTLVLLAAFPTSFFLMAGYTEPLFLALTLGAFLSAYHRQWLLAGVLAYFAALTRLQGIVLCLPLAYIAYVQHRAVGVRSLLERVPAVVGAALGTLTYWGYIRLNNLGSMDDMFAWGWKLRTDFPWVSVFKFFERWRTADFESCRRGVEVCTFGMPQHELNNAFILLVMIGLAVLVTLRMRPEYALYSWATLIVLMLRFHYGEDLEGAQFESVFRYVLLLFPCFIMAAKLLRSRWALAAYVLICVQWGLYFLDRFYHWRWVA
jgi:Gpi18-like mannosyltransferase